MSTQNECQSYDKTSYYMADKIVPSVPEHLDRCADDFFPYFCRGNVELDVLRISIGTEILCSN